MKLFRLTLIGERGACVVRAADESAARKVAVKYKSVLEETDVWLDSDLSICTEITVDGKPGLILKSD